MPLVLLLALACSGPTADDTGPEPGPCASTAMPTVDFDVTAGLRVETYDYTHPWTEARDSDVHIWYPSAATSGNNPRYADIFEDTQSFVNASYDPPNAVCTHPLMVWSHGSQAWAGNAHDLMRQFVAAGWIVAAPTHTGNTIDDNLDPRPKGMPAMRVADVVETIDRIEALPSDDPLFGRIDTSRVLVMGHSFGGQTAWLLSGPTYDLDRITADCEGHDPACTPEELAVYAERPGDPRVVGVIPLAGSAGESLVSDAGWGTMDVPVFYMTGSEDHDGTEPFTRASEGEVTWAEVAGGCHETFTNTALGCPGVEKMEGLRITATYALAFGTSEVLSSEDPEVSAILDGTTSVSELVTLQQ